MELTKAQNKYISNKNIGFSVIKGGSGVGKTTALVYRLINLENNYCIYEDDQILFLSRNANKLNSAEELHKEYNDKSQFYSLFSLEEGRTKFYNIDDLINEYCNRYLKGQNLYYKDISSGEAHELLKSSIFKDALDGFIKKSKILRSMNLQEIYDEILWIKACGFLKEEYILCERKLKKRRINKNSLSRVLIYSLLEIYNSLLKSNNYMDIYDKVLYANEYVKKNCDKYTHILVDDIQYFTKMEIEFIKNLYRNSNYSTISFTYNNDVEIGVNNWFVKGQKLKTVWNDFKGKCHILKKKFEDFSVKGKSYMEKYQYIDFKHKNISEFDIDTSLNEKEIYLNQDISFNESELLEIPVFNDIAAGSPIEINDNIEDAFYLPKVWLEKGRNIFILHVKGNSMIGKNIYDGDLVVIKNQQAAYHNDIVAASIDGEATLKILNTSGSIPYLMPANDSYSSISLEDKEVTILGVALGVIKPRN